MDWATFWAIFFTSSSGHPGVVFSAGMKSSALHAKHIMNLAFDLLIQCHRLPPKERYCALSQLSKLVIMKQLYNDMQPLP
jgi:hypothetical protein